jgi:hypothetical protein
MKRGNLAAGSAFWIPILCRTPCALCAERVPPPPPTHPTDRTTTPTSSRPPPPLCAWIISLSLSVAAACERMQPAAPPLLDIINTLAVLSSAAHTRRLALVCSSLGSLTTPEHKTRSPRPRSVSLSVARLLVVCEKEVHSRASKSEAAPIIGMPKIVKARLFFSVS